MPRALTRRGFLRGAVAVGTGAVTGLAWADPELKLTIPFWTKTQGLFPPLIGIGPETLGGPFNLPGGLSPEIPQPAASQPARLFDLDGLAYDSPIMSDAAYKGMPGPAYKGPLLTDNGLFYLVAHGRVPLVNWDPKRCQPVEEHVLLVHGEVDRPTIFTLRDLMEGFETHDKVHFLECAGNSFRGYFQSPTSTEYPTLSPQQLNGLVSGTKWTGVLVRDVLSHVGVKESQDLWVLAEGADGAVLDRSIPIDKMMSDALLAFRQNDAPLQREQGYPLRLVLPGWEGNANVKWLRRLKVGTGPFMSREEATDYSDYVCVESSPRDAVGLGWHFTMVMEVKSVITTPSPGGAKLEKGFKGLTGLAWSGRGPVREVTVHVDDRAFRAELDPPVLDQALTRFRVRDWTWDGGPTIIKSRAKDDFGWQPDFADLRADRGLSYFYHYNAVFPYLIQQNGTVVNHVA